MECFDTFLWKKDKIGRKKSSFVMRKPIAIFPNSLVTNQHKAQSVGLKISVVFFCEGGRQQ